MKVTKVYEVWVGGDMIADGLTLDQAILEATKEFKSELEEHPSDPADVVVDEHSYITIESFEDLDKLG